MIESAFAQNPAQLTQHEDAGYRSWQSAAHRAVMRHDLNDRTAGPIPSFGSMIHKTALAAQDMSYMPQGPQAMNGASPDITYDAQDDSFGFSDVLDIINPLQHFPVIGTFYRKFTGDTIKPLSNIVGAALFGGPIGAASSAVNLAVKQGTGKDLAENALSMVGFESATTTVKPAIEIEAPIESLFKDSAKSLAAANLYDKAASGQRNFSSRSSTYSWNT
jgi:hypothetical protein